MHNKRVLKIRTVSLGAQLSAHSPWIVSCGFRCSPYIQRAQWHFYNSRALKLRFEFLCELRRTLGMLTTSEHIQHLPRLSRFLASEDDVELIRSRSQPTSYALFELCFFSVNA